ncbi:MAG: ExbD/TolR family protein [Myxococcota bacterium]|jgi:biopolymer transport protein ExbD
MGGAVEAAPQKGGKKAMDAAINLVPYIDLLMTIMTFLIMTAVWTQIAMLEVQNAQSGPPDSPPPEEKEPIPAILVLVTENSLKIQEEGGEARDFPKGNEGFDLEGAKAVFEQLKQARPERVEVKVNAEDTVPYTDIIGVIDTATGSGLTGITLSPVGS